MERSFARRLEAAEELAGASVARAHRKMIAGSRAEVFAIAGGTANFVDPSSPVTQCIGCGVDRHVTNTEIDLIEQFYFSRGAASQIVVSTEFAPELQTTLEARGYQIAERNLAFYRLLPFREPLDPPAGFAIREVREPERSKWAAMQAQIFAEHAEMAAMLEPLFMLFAASQGYRSYVAIHEAASDLAAGAAIYISPESKLACIAGAATKNTYRVHGLQQALLRRRLIDATSAGCDLAFMSTLLDTTSCRNAQRQGFVRGYERVVMRKEAPAAAKEIGLP